MVAIEFINLLRPIVAISTFITFSAVWIDRAPSVFVRIIRLGHLLETIRPVRRQNRCQQYTGVDVRMRCGLLDTPHTCTSSSFIRYFKGRRQKCAQDSFPGDGLGPLGCQTAQLRGIRTQIERGEKTLRLLRRVNFHPFVKAKEPCLSKVHVRLRPVEMVWWIPFSLSQVGVKSFTLEMTVRRRASSCRITRYSLLIHDIFTDESHGDHITDAQHFTQFAVARVNRARIYLCLNLYSGPAHRVVSRRARERR